MSAFFTFLGYQWWWFWPSVALAAYVVALFVATVLVGWTRVRPFALPLVAVIGALFLLARARGQGYAKRETQEGDAADQASGEFQNIHKKDEGLSDGKLDKINQPWTRG